jgi:hypothetical protein
MIDSSPTRVLQSLVLCRSTSRCVLVSPLLAVLLGCLLITPWVIISIVAKFATLETAIRFDWCSCVVVLGRCVHDASLTIMLLATKPLTGLSVVSLAGSNIGCSSDLVVQSIVLDNCCSLSSFWSRTENLGSCSDGYSCWSALGTFSCDQTTLSFCFQGQLPC